MKKTMKIGFLISTMNQSDYSLMEKINVVSNAVVVNQSSDFKVQKIESIYHKNHRIKWINSNERGLSKSRNKALKYADFDIGLISDDDLVYCNNVIDVVRKYFLLYPNADIIAFQVVGIDGTFKKYKPNIEKIGYLKSMKKASVELAINIKSIKEKEISFNETFGSGSKYKMGEDNIFLFDALKKDLNIIYIPEKIANLYMGDSSWFSGYTDEYFFDLGAVYSEMSKYWSILLILQFAIRKYKLYKKENTFLNSLKNMLNGRKTYLSSIKIDGSDT